MLQQHLNPKYFFIVQSQWWVFVPSCNGGHLVCVVLGDHFEELVENNRKEADDDMNLVHTKKALRGQK